MKRIVLTGGGTTGHVTPNLALIDPLEQSGWRIDYIGSEQGIERTMMEKEGIAYHAIRTGKLHRYLTWKNILAPFQVMKGIVQAFQHLRRLRPDVVFSKGGFVAFPVVLSAWLLKIPVIAHESDLTPGLANRLCFPFVNQLCLAFAGTQQHFKKHHQRIQVTGTPIREVLFHGQKLRALKHCGWDGSKPVLLVMGGSLGSQMMNQHIRQVLPTLIKTFHVIHLCGPGKRDVALDNIADYFQCEYAFEEMPDFLAASDVVVSRSGANSLYELLALAKPHVLIPLSKKASRGDQIENAHYFEQQGISVVIEEQHLTSERLQQDIERVFHESDERIRRMKVLNTQSATEQIMEMIESLQK